MRTLTPKFISLCEEILMNIHHFCAYSQQWPTSSSEFIKNVPFKATPCNFSGLVPPQVPLLHKMPALTTFMWQIVNDTRSYDYPSCPPSLCQNKAEVLTFIHFTAKYCLNLFLLSISLRVPHEYFFLTSWCVHDRPPLFLKRYWNTVTWEVLLMNEASPLVLLCSSP